MIYNSSNNVDVSTGCNSELLANNSFFNSVRNNNELYFVHITKNKNLIKRDGCIFPSGGCLLGSVYFTPGYLDEKKNRIRLHNLGRYYYECECPNVIKNRNLMCSPSILIFKVNCGNIKPNVIGINYLKFGQMHFDIYIKLKYLLTKNEKEELENIVYNKLVNSLQFLKSINEIKNNSCFKKREKFLDNLIKTVDYLPILGYVYFEALNKTLMLHQCDELSKKYKSKGEFYNWHYKQLMLHFIPDFFSKFNLGTFKLPFNEVLEYILSNKLIDDVFKFKEDFFNQLFVYLSDALNLDNDTLFRLEDINLNIENTSSYYHPLIGHIIHRELRNFDRYPDFYFYFDQVKAMEIWNEWNKRDIVIPYNSIIPKGEIGLNPAYLDNLNYEVFEGIGYKVEDDFAYIELGNRLDVKIAKKLVENKHSMMRNCDCLDDDK